MNKIYIVFTFNSIIKMKITSAICFTDYKKAYDYCNFLSGKGYLSEIFESFYIFDMTCIDFSDIDKFLEEVSL